MQHKLASNRLSLRGAVALLLVLYIGSGSAFGGFSTLGADTIFAQVASFFIAAPLLLLFARLIRLMPEMDLFDMLTYTVGRVPAVLIGVLYFFYFIMLSATTQVYHAEFVGMISLVNTPLIVILLAFFLVGAYLAKSGAETMSKWSLVVALTVAGLALTLTLFAFPSMRAGNIQPILTHSVGDMARAGTRLAILPLGEAVVLLALISRFDKHASPYKLFFIAASLATVFFAANFLRDSAVLGADSMGAMHYPAFRAASTIQLGSIGTRVEFLVVISFLLTSVTKTAICVLAAARAIRSVFNLPDENPLILSIAFFAVALSVILFRNMIDLFAFPYIYVYYAPIFQMVIPVVVWVIAEVKVRRKAAAESHQIIDETAAK